MEGARRLLIGHLLLFASQVPHVQEFLRNLLTRYDESLDSHDEDDLHWSKFAKPKFPPLAQGEGEFTNEDGTEPTDADRGRDIRCTLQPYQVCCVGCGQDITGIFDAEGEAETGGHQYNEDGDDKEGLTMNSAESDAYNTNLKNK